MIREKEAPLSRNQLSVIVKKARQAKEENYKEQSRKRLDSIISTKMRTSFIGALSAFEDELGFLWGHSTAPDELTDEQKSMREIWETIRTRVLNNGNNQLRAAKSELANHLVHWNRYHLDMKVTPSDDDTEPEVIRGN